MVSRVAVIFIFAISVLASRATAQCDGAGECFCDEGSSVPISQLIRGVNVALGLAACPADPSPPIHGCGNDVVESGESCDGADLNGESCATFGYAEGDGLACTPECKLDASGCESTEALPPRFRDDGNGIAADLNSGLMWELKRSGATVHGTQRFYSWSVSGRAPDGTVFTQFLETLNDRCEDDETTDCSVRGDLDCVGAPDIHASTDRCGFGGFRDWRLPTVLELKFLLVEPYSAGSCSTSPCIDPELPGIPSIARTWTGTSRSSDQSGAGAWFVNFIDGTIASTLKTNSFAARAVRGGP